MRVPALLLATVCPLFAQFKSTVPLVVAPATVTDGKGRFVDGLTADDLTLYDNNVRHKVRLEDTFVKPISLVVVIEASSRVWDRMSDEEKAEKHPTEGKHPFPSPEEQMPLPPEMAPGSFLTIFTELKQRSKVDAAALFTRTTGARTFSFLKQSGLEEAIQAVGEEVHRQYVISYQPAPDKAGIFHAMRMEVRGRPDLQVRTRAGYWSVE